MNEMTTNQALQMLDGAVSTMQLNREQHGNLQMALQTLAQAVVPKPEPAKDEAKKETKPEAEKK